MAKDEETTQVPPDPCDVGDCKQARMKYFQTWADAQVASDAVKAACKKASDLGNMVAALAAVVAGAAFIYWQCATITVIIPFFGQALCAAALVVLLAATAALAVAAIAFFLAQQEVKKKMQDCVAKQATLQAAYKDMVAKCPSQCIDKPDFPSCGC